MVKPKLASRQKSIYTRNRVFVIAPLAAESLQEKRIPYDGLASGGSVAGYFYHAVSGLDFTMYRAYDPAHARWLNRDPIGEAGGVNLYAYANGDPIGNFDPTGLDCVSAGGRTICNYPGGPAFNIPTPPNFPSYLGPKDFLYHSYEVSVSENCSDDNMMAGLINSPAPGNPMSPATVRRHAQCCASIRGKQSNYFLRHK